jgi:hypothetical protein
VINLDSWESQARGLREAARTVRAGGLLLLSEATVQGHGKINDLRGEWGLPPIPEPDFNRYLDEDAVCEALADEAELVELVNFASTYFVGTRVIKPLLAQLLDRAELIADPNSHWNRNRRTAHVELLLGCELEDVPRFQLQPPHLHRCAIEAGA